MFTKTIPAKIGYGGETRLMIWESVSELAANVAARSDIQAKKVGGRQWVTGKKNCTTVDQGPTVRGDDIVLHDCEMSGFNGREGFSGFDDAAKAALSSWPEGIQIVEQMLTEIYREPLPVPETTRRRRKMSRVDGQMLDVERLRAGKAFWRTNKRRRAVGPTHLTVITDVSATAYVSHRDIMWRGAASIALMDVLEGAGYRCEHWAAKRTNVIGIDIRSKRWVSELQAVCTKRQGEPLDVSGQVNAVSGWFMRTILFGAKSLTGDVALGQYLGSPSDLLDSDIREITSDRRVLVSQGIDSYRGAVRWVGNCVRRYIKGGRIGEGEIDRGGGSYA